MISDQVREDARAALERLREQGWCKRSAVLPPDELGRQAVCLMAAVACAAGAAVTMPGVQYGYHNVYFPDNYDFDRYLALRTAINRIITEQHPEYPDASACAWAGSPMISFNDAPQTSFADVERLLEKVAAG